MTREEAAAILESEAEYLYSQDEPYNREAFDMAIEALKQEPVKHGKWIPSDLDKDFMTCPVCKFENRRYRMAYRKDYLKVLKYCPNCGTRMSGGSEE